MTNAEPTVTRIPKLKPSLIQQQLELVDIGFDIRHRIRTGTSIVRNDSKQDP